MDQSLYFNFYSLLSEASLLGLASDVDSRIKECEEFLVFCKNPDEWIFEQGHDFDHLIISLDSDIELFSGNSSQQMGSGRITPGRAAELYSFLKKEKHRYSGRLTSEGHYLKIPIRIVDGWLAEDKSLQTHLERSVSSLEYRSLNKQFQSFGASPRFIVEFLGRMQEENLPSQHWLLHQEKISPAFYFILQGSVQVLKIDEFKNFKNLLIVPLKTWVLFKECDEMIPSRHSFRTLEDVKLFKINYETLRWAETKWEADLGKFRTWATTSKGSSSAEFEADATTQDIDELFKESVEYTRSPWKPFPWVGQNDMMDCGPACLAMISKYYGKNLPIQFWRSQLSTDKEGTRLFDLAQCGEKNGLISQALEMESISQVDKSLLPAIILRKYHYLVLYKVEKNAVIVGDPAIGITKMSFAEINNGLESFVLVIKPKPDFFKLEGSATSYKHFLKLFQGLGPEICLTALCSFLMMVLSLFPPLFTQIMLDEVLSKKDMKLLYYTLGGAFLISATTVLLDWARSYYIAFLTTKFDFKAKSIFLNKMLSLKYSYFATRHVGDFTRRLNELDRVRQFMTGNFLRLVLNLSMVGFYLAVVFFYHPAIALTLIILSPPFLLISMVFSRRLVQTYSETFSKQAESDSFMVDLVKAISTIKSLGAELSSRWKFEEKLVDTLQARDKFIKTSTFASNMSGLYFNLVKYGCIGLSVYLGIRGELSPGQVIALGMIINQVIEPFRVLGEEWSEIQEVNTVLGRLNDVFLAPSEAGILAKGLKPEIFKGEIEFKDVWFRYGGESSNWVLKGVSFKIEAGQNVALIGPSGCGKSTVASLLNRLYEPTKGQIFIDGRDLRDFDLGWLRSQLGLLLQESHLFQGTLAENISFNDPEVDLTLLDKSTQKANATKIISEKSLGYEYFITHGGFGLSGGEKQRIALARLFYQQPKLFILDEATSALDGIAEGEFLRQLKAVAKTSTIINIAHRYSTVRFSDYIIVMSEGRVIDYGSHEDLQAQSEIYNQLFGFYLDSKMTKVAS